LPGLAALRLRRGSVCLDAITPNVQQKLLGNTKNADSKASEAEVMMYSNAFACFMLVPSSVLTGKRIRVR
jgi:hypothetical protein